MTKIELQQANTKLSTENDALRAEISRLSTQIKAPRTGHDGFKALLAELKAAGAGAKIVGNKVVRG